MASPSRSTQLRADRELCAAVKNGYLTAVKRALRSGVSPDARHVGVPLLCLAAMASAVAGRLAIVLADSSKLLQYRQSAIAALLVERGADIGACTLVGDSPLVLASRVSWL